MKRTGGTCAPADETRHEGPLQGQRRGGELDFNRGCGGDVVVEGGGEGAGHGLYCREGQRGRPGCAHRKSQGARDAEASEELRKPVPQEAVGSVTRQAEQRAGQGAEWR